MLRWYPQLGRSVVYPFNTSPTNPRRFFLYNHHTDTVEREFDCSDDCDGCFDLSSDGQLLAVKYWHRRHIDIVDVGTSTIKSSFGPSRVWELRFDDTANKLLVKAKSGGLSVYKLAPPHNEIRVAHSRDVANGCSITGRNEFLLPSRRKGHVIHIDFNRDAVTERYIPLKCTVRCIRHAPTASTLFLLDSSGAVSCYDSTLDQLFWRTRVHPFPNDGYVVDGAFSGNGQLIGLAVVHDDGCNTIVLDSATGKLLGTFTGVSPGKYPYRDDCTLSPMGEVLDLRTGVASDDLGEIADY